MKALQPLSRAGCLVSVIAPIVAIIVYPKANWLFAFVLFGVALIVFELISRKQPAPTEVADRAEHLLDGSYGEWDVDDYEHLNPKERLLKDLWLKTMNIGGLPEKWVKLDEAEKEKLRSIIRQMRDLRSSRS